MGNGQVVMGNENERHGSNRRPATKNSILSYAKDVGKDKDGILSHEYSPYLLGKRGTRWHLVPQIFAVSARKTWDKMASCPTNIRRICSENVGQDGILSHEYSPYLLGKRGTRWHLVPQIFAVSARKTWDKMASCPTNIRRIFSENVGQDGILSHKYSPYLLGKRGTRWHLVPQIFAVSARKTWDKMASCPTNIRRICSENVGQDGILSHEYSSIQGEFWGLLNDSSLTIHGESQQQIARIADEAAVTGICIEDAVNDGRTAAVQRAAFRLSGVDRVDRLRGVNIPDDRAVFGRISAQMSVRRAGEDHARDDGRRRRLRVVALPRSPTALGFWRGNVPELLSAGDLQSGQTGLASRPSARVGDRYVDVIRVGREAPFDAAERAAVTDLHLPQDLSIVVRIEGPHYARFLAAQQYLLSAGESS